MNQNRQTVIAAAVLASVSGTAAAQIDFYDTRASWAGATSGVITTEGFEGRDAFGPINGPKTFTSGLTVAELTDDVTVRVETEEQPVPVNNLLNTTEGGSQFLRFGVFDEFDPYTISFELPHVSNAFAYDIMDWEPIFTGGGKALGLFRDGELVLDFFFQSDSGGPFLESPVPPLFFGFTSDVAFDEVQIIIPSFDGVIVGLPNDNRVDFVGIDEVAFVPAPGALFIAGAAGMVTASRRRHR